LAWNEREQNVLTHANLIYIYKLLNIIYI